MERAARLACFLSSVDKVIEKTREKEEGLRKQWRQRRDEFLEFETKIKAEIDTYIREQEHLQTIKERVKDLSTPLSTPPPPPELTPPLTESPKKKEKVTFEEEEDDESSVVLIEETPKKKKDDESSVVLLEETPMKKEEEEELEESPMIVEERIVFKKVVPFTKWKDEEYTMRTFYFSYGTTKMAFTHMYQENGDKSSSYHCVRMDTKAPRLHLKLLIERVGEPVFTTTTTRGHDTSYFYTNLTASWIEHINEEIDDEDEDEDYGMAVVLYPSKKPTGAGRPKMCTLCKMSLKREEFFGAGYRIKEVMCQKHRYCVACTAFMTHLAQDEGLFPCLGLGAVPGKNQLSVCML